MTCFSSRGTGSIIDVTLASQAASKSIKNWKVLNIYSASDHNYISFTVDQKERSRSVPNTRKRWNIRRLNKQKFTVSLEEARLLCELESSWIGETQSVDDMVATATKIVSAACDVSMPKVVQNNGRNPKYWWNDKIKEARNECTRAWRRSVRSRGDEELKRLHVEAKKSLRKEIRQSKKNSWKDLLKDIDNDPWGLAYRIVRKRLRVRQDIPELNDPEFVERIIRDLFPEQIREKRDRPTDFVFDEEDLFTMDELREEVRSLKSNKAPGPDNIPNEVLKIVVDTCPDVLLNVFNACLRQGVFPRAWKVQNLVLLRKGDKPVNEPSSYRPLGLLDTMGKLLEALILRRMRKILERKYSDRQYGFRKGRSTVDAILAVLDVVREGKKKTGKRHGFCAVIALDIRNAFNSARWIDFMRSLIEKGVPEYLLRIVDDYLDERKVVYGNIEVDMTGGATQGSKMGPDLWDSSYDEFLEMPLPENSVIFGFADDSLLLCWSDDERILEMNVNTSLFLMKRWMDSKGLQLAIQKTEAILVTDRRVFRVPEIVLGTERIEWKKHLRYLGVELDTKLKFAPHILKATGKALQTAAQLGRLMPNMEGPSQWKRRILCSSAHSQMLYAAPIWADALAKNQTLRSKVLSVQRILAMRVTSAYRTIATSSVLVLAGTPPADLLALECRDRYAELKKYTAEERTPALKERTRKAVRKTLEEGWQERWDSETTGRWTHVLIPNISSWMNRGHGQVNFYLTQALSGHGCFRAYLKRFKRSSQSSCHFCESEMDDAEHTLFHCHKWREPRECLQQELGRRLRPSNMVCMMLESQEKWRCISDFIVRVMKEKELYFRRRQEETEDGDRVPNT